MQLFIVFSLGVLACVGSEELDNEILEPLSFFGDCWGSSFTPFNNFYSPQSQYPTYPGPAAMQARFGLNRGYVPPGTRYGPSVQGGGVVASPTNPSYLYVAGNPSRSFVQYDGLCGFGPGAGNAGWDMYYGEHALPNRLRGGGYLYAY
ncbi:hypothetical protein PAPYR_3547 [Paratrimastix pyriformis]|uniref:Uncharacterized protein n=1 Tax=Paratrimastix pyriformis TaxID=342808 RepID=A0ABQ8URK9_9EUKA|nr:hypothetical protein PAPYR_3547 [Paratrimastix pyriformis]